MHESNQRWAYYYDLNLESSPKEAPSFSMDYVLNKVEALWKNGGAVRKYRNEEVTIRVAEIKIIENYAAILIHLADTKATDPAFSNTETGDVRVEEKQLNEGIGVACHVLISKSKLKNRKNSYLAMIEEMKGIPKSTVQQFLQGMLRASCTRDYKPSPNSDKVNKCRPTIKLEGHGSDSLKDSLKKSVLTGITLLDSREGLFFDDDKELRMTKKQLELKVKGSPNKNKALQLIEKAQEIGRDDYDHIRVYYSEIIAQEKKRTPSGKEKIVDKKKQRNVSFDTKTANIAEALFTKSESIRLSKEIGQCEKVIHIELVNKMKKLLNEAI